jgi:glycosyltransferase involved in cell wall biosynthesis
MNIVIHTQYYPPETGAPQARLFALTKGLIRRGHHVTVLTAMPNYPQGKIHDGYSGWMKIEHMDSARVLRSWIVPAQGRSFSARLLNYFSFVFSSFWTGLFYLDSPDVIITESPPLFLGITGYLLAKLKGARWIFNVSDLWPESAVRLGMAHEGLALQASRWLEEFCYRNAWAVKGQSREILADITARFPDTRVYHLSNGADTETFHPDADPLPHYSQGGGDVVGLYAGLHGLAQGLDQILSAVQRLADMEELKIVFFGDGPLKHDLIQQAREIPNVRFFDSRPHSEMPALLAGADFCIVSLGLSLPGAVPSKLYEAMAAGRPVLLVADGEAAEIVRAHGCGLIVSPGDVDGIAQAIRRLATDADLRQRLGDNGRLAAQAHFDHQTIMDRFADFLEQEVK